MRRFAVLAAAAFAAACSPKDTNPTGDQQVRLRNSLPAACTAEQLKACPAPEVTACLPGHEPVLDYSSDCCIHFTCQPVCVAAKACSPTPAPVCPPNTTLWIGTALEDCCPAYRCEAANPSTCDPKTAVCAQVMPYCGAGILPIVTGTTADCCPIYQCPCDLNGGAAGKPTDSSATSPCGCTFPTCKPGEVMACEGKDPCRGPCTCKPIPTPGLCKADSDCAAGQHCEAKACPGSSGGSAGAPLCQDPTKCGLPPPLPVKPCSDGSVAGPTGRCIAGPGGTCTWEIAECPVPPPDCAGVCVPDSVTPPPPPTGCSSNADCGASQTCVVSCEGWACTAAAGSTTNGCACPPNEPACKCDSTGTTCGVQTCKGVCVDVPKCDPSKPIACPALAIVCPVGSTLQVIGTDPTTCCPIEKCIPRCELTSSTSIRNCAIPPRDAANCKCIKLKATDPTTCCPVYECGTPDATTGACL